MPNSYSINHILHALENFCYLSHFVTVLLRHHSCSRNLFTLAGPAFIDIPHREPEYPSDNEGVENPPRPSKESSICEANFGFPSAANAVQVFGPWCRCSCFSRVRTHPVGRTRGLQDIDRVIGKCLMFKCRMHFSEAIRMIVSKQFA